MSRIEIDILPEIGRKCPNLQLGCLSAAVQAGPSGPELLRQIEDACREISAGLSIDAISSLPRICATREAYKAAGKKPGRYRPSAEALLRRVVSGKGLYQINNVVEVINLCSIATHYSIGGYDAALIAGATGLGIGREGEPYQAIARGELNIGGLPVLRDEQGAFGSPTSDSTRTMIREESKRILLVFFNFGGDEGLAEAMNHAAELLERHCQGRELEFWQR